MPFHMYFPREYKIPYRLRGLHSPFRPGVLRVPPWNSPLIRRYMTCRFFLIPLHYSRFSQMSSFYLPPTKMELLRQFYEPLSANCLSFLHPQLFSNLVALYSFYLPTTKMELLRQFYEPLSENCLSFLPSYLFFLQFYYPYYSPYYSLCLICFEFVYI